MSDLVPFAPTPDASSVLDALPWASLGLGEEDIPWDDLRKLADAVAVSTDARARLLQTFEQAVAEVTEDDRNLRDVAIPAVVAMAAQRLDAEGRREAAVALLEGLYEAGDRDDDFTLELLPRAISTLGRPAAEAALELLSREGVDMECFFHLTAVLSHAPRVDGDAREPVLQACRALLLDRRYHYERYTPLGAIAGVVADLGDRESLPLLKRLHKRSGSGDVLEAIHALQGDPESAMLFGRPQEPVESWLPEFVRRMKSHFRRVEASAQTEVPEPEAVPVEPSEAQRLYEEFETSEPFRTLPSEAAEHASFVVNMFQDYLQRYLGASLLNMHPEEVEEVIVDILPRKVAEEQDFYEAIPPVLTAFFGWLGDTGWHARARDLIDAVQSGTEAMLTNAADPGYWDMAKSCIMSARRAGVDLSDQLALDAYMKLYNLGLYASPEPSNPPPPPMPLDDYPPLVSPIHRGTPRVGRNDPCTCGSGRKYKKCCGKG